MSELAQCILCGNVSPARPIASLRDNPNGLSKVVACGHCGHRQISPLPSPEEEEAYYADDKKPRELFGDVDFLDIIKLKARKDTERRLDWLRRTRTPSGSPRVLDVGAGYGFFVDLASKAGYNAWGMEPSVARHEFSRDNMAGTFVNAAVDEAFVAQHRGQWDVVTTFHVLEHLRDPVSYLSLLLALVAPGGHLIVEVPNAADELIPQIPEYGAFHWVSVHLNYFDAARLDLALKKAGATDFSIEGIQRYGLRHLIRWTDMRAPDLHSADITGGSPLLDAMEEQYRAYRQRALTSDTIGAVIRVNRNS